MMTESKRENDEQGQKRKKKKKKVDALTGDEDEELKDASTDAFDLLHDKILGQCRIFFFLFKRNPHLVMRSALSQHHDCPFVSTSMLRFGCTFVRDNIANV